MTNSPPTTSIDVQLPGGSTDLTAPEFDAQLYIGRLRGVIPVSQLQRSIEKEVTQIRARLRDLVNEKHSDVVELTIDLRRVTNRLPSMKETLSGYSSLCQELLNNTDALHQKIKPILCDHSRFQAQISHMEASLLLYKAIQENLSALKILQDLGSSGACLLLELLAAETQWIGDVIIYLEDTRRKAGELLPTKGFRGQQQPVTDSQSEALIASTDAMLKELSLLLRKEVMLRLHGALNATLSALQGRNESSASGYKDTLQAAVHVVAGFMSLKCEEEVAEVLRLAVTKPALIQTLDECSIRTADQISSGPSRADAEALSRFLEKLRRQVDSSLSPIFQLVSEMNSVELVVTAEASKLKGSLISSAVIFPILTAIEQEFAACFVPVFPDVFVENYRGVHSLIDHILSLSTEFDRRSFKTSSEWIHFDNRWRTQSYEAGRYRLLFTALKQTFEDDPRAELSSRASFFKLSATDALVKSVSALLDPQKLIEKERPRVIRSISEIFLIHYHSYLQTLEARVAQTSTSNESVQSVLGHCLFDMTRLMSMLKPISLESEPTTNLRLLAAPTSLDSSVRDIISRLFDVVVCDLTSMKKTLEDLLVKGLLNKIARELVAMRGVSPVYRMTNRQINSTPSPYVSAVNSALKEFQNTVSEVCGTEDYALWLSSALRQSFALFSIRLDEVVSAIESQEISLKKLQRRKITQPTDGINDVEKIARQLLIMIKLNDSQAFIDPWLPFVTPSEGSDADGVSMLRQSMSKLDALIPANSSIAKPKLNE